MIADKICAHHLERKAILYVRQSSPHQVLHNREGGALQYAMRDRLTALGFAEIEVIDDDSLTFLPRLVETEKRKDTLLPIIRRKAVADLIVYTETLSRL